MRKPLLGVALSVAFIAIVPGRAQAPAVPAQHIWSLDFLKCKPGMYGQTLSLLDLGWSRARAEAKRSGIIVSYHRVADEPAASSPWDIILLTEYESQAAYDNRESAFEPILKNLFPDGPPHIGLLTKKDLYEIVSSRILKEYPENGPARLLPVKP